MERGGAKIRSNAGFYAGIAETLSLALVSMAVMRIVRTNE